MGYFSNGTEGADYQERYCFRCIHDIAESCPVWNAHLLHNYEECNNKSSILHHLIPKTDDGLGNRRCTMFLDVSLLSPLAREKYKHELTSSASSKERE